jgi:hypothetical protein
MNMTHPESKNHHSGRHLKVALEQANRLAQPGMDRTPHWTAQAAQVGDMSVLLLALRS